MLDDPENTSLLLAALKTAEPFKVTLMPDVVLHLRGKQVAAVAVEQTLADLSLRRRRRWHRVPPRLRGRRNRTLRVADPRSSAAVHAACRSRVAVPEASRKKTEETGPTVEDADLACAPLPYSVTASSLPRSGLVQ